MMMTSASCGPTSLAHLYKRLLSTVAVHGRRDVASGRLWPGANRHYSLSAPSIDLRLPSWLSFSAITAAASSITIPRPKAVDRPKHKPDLDSNIYQLMSSPVLFDPIRKPRNKIVLCHGLYGFDVRGPASFPKLQLHYWSKVLEILRGKVGAEVEVTGVPGTGSIESRATRLHESLSTRMPNQPINFIAHSMGGLDCRYLISRIRPTEYAPQSLTTVSTPHRGSSFMDWCSANIGVGEFSALEDGILPYSLKEPLLSRPRTAGPTSLAHLYKRLLSTVAVHGRRDVASGRLWPGANRHYSLSAPSIDLRPPSWLSFSAITAAASSITIPRPKAVDRPKHKPDLDSTIYQLMSSPVLFDPIRKPRNKIVLCHGLYGFDVRGPASFPKLQLHYWSKVLEILRGKVGAEVEVTGVPGTGSIESRATRLHESLSTRMPNQPINFIAHSMGGLDCRYLISRIRPTEYAPQSLTTVSTPHRGSSFMDWCSANIGVGEFSALEDGILPYSLKEPLLSRPRTARETETAKTILGLITSLPQNLTTMLLALLDSPAYANLTTSFLHNTFNPNTPDVEGVKYYSVGARARDDMSVFHPLWLPKTILDAAEAENLGKTPEWGSEFQDIDGWAGVKRRWRGHDGLVSVASSRWGEFLGVIEGADHWELRGSSGVSPVSSHASTSPGTSPDTSSTNGWSEWAKSFSLWQAARSTDASNGGDEQRAKATAALDWVVNAVSSSHAANPGGEHDPARIKRRSEDGVPVFELERFYVALCKKLYDDGL
ncbi:Triacylglycerol lipase, partial [Rhizoctonia solani]